MTYQPMSNKEAAQEAAFWDATNKDTSLIPTGWVCPYCAGLGWLIQYTLAGLRDVDEEWEPCRCNPKHIPATEFQKK